MSASILQHKSSPVTFDPPPADPREQLVRDPYPVTPESIDAAQVYQSIERQACHYTPPTNEEWELMSAHEGLMNLIQKYGAERVQRWVYNLAAIAGQHVTRDNS